jgi:hypothetical protein
MSKSVDILEMLSVAQAAYRINGFAMLREAKDNKNSNGVMVKAHYYEPDKHRITVTDDDRTQAEAIRNYLTQRSMLAKLTGRPLSDFATSVADKVESDKASLRDVGILTWATKVCADLQKADDAQQDFARISITSNFVGKIKGKVEIDFTTITKRWSNNYGCFRYTGHDGNGNLIGFLSKNDYPAVVRLKARVKAHETGRLTGGKTTYLNYTKAIGE